MEAIRQGENFLLCANLISPHPVTNMCGIFSNRVWPSSSVGQPKAVSVAWLFGDLGDSSDQQLEGKCHTIGTGPLICNLWLLCRVRWNRFLHMKICRYSFIWNFYFKSRFCMAFISFLSVNYSSLNPSSTLDSHSYPHLIPTPHYFSFPSTSPVFYSSPSLKIFLPPSSVCGHSQHQWVWREDKGPLLNLAIDLGWQLNSPF